MDKANFRLRERITADLQIEFKSSFLDVSPLSPRHNENDSRNQIMPMHRVKSQGKPRSDLKKKMENCNLSFANGRIEGLYDLNSRTPRLIFISPDFLVICCHYTLWVTLRQCNFSAEEKKVLILLKWHQAQLFLRLTPLFVSEAPFYNTWPFSINMPHQSHEMSCAFLRMYKSTQRM